MDAKGERPLVSVIMPAYNAEKYIEEAIRSVLSQTYTNWKLLILDEPTNGLDIEATVEIREIIIRLAKEKGVTFLVASHLASEIEKMCDKVLVLYEGEMLSFDTKEEALRLHPSLEDYFLAKVRDKKGSVVL